MNENPMKVGPPQAATIQPTATPSRLEQKQPEQSPQKPRYLVQPKPAPVLGFSPTAWAKLLFFRDRQETEVGGFAITSADDLLRVQDFITVKQDVSMASVCFDDQAVADFFEAQVDAGRKPEQFARIWLHSHPGDSPQPSSTDEETFHRVFGHCDWAVMFIVARNGKSYTRLRFNVGPGGQMVIPVGVDFKSPFAGSDRDAWEAEYKANIWQEDWLSRLEVYQDVPPRTDLSCCSVPEDWLDGLEAMEPAERRMILDELAARPDLWDDDREVFYD